MPSVLDTFITPLLVLIVGAFAMMLVIQPVGAFLTACLGSGIGGVQRADYRARVIRSQESRTSLGPQQGISADACVGLARPAGAIAVSHAGYLRYEGEVENSRTDLEADERMNVVGADSAQDMRLLSYIRDGFGWKFAN